MINPGMPSEFVREVDDHEVLLCFLNDWEAVAFTDWWHENGVGAYNKWVEENKGDYH